MKIKHACGSHPAAVHAPYLGHPGNPRLLGRPRLVAIFLCTETVGQTSNDNADLVVIHYLHIPTASPQSKNCTHSEFKFTLNTSDLYPIFMSFLYIKKKNVNKCGKPSAQPSVKGVSNFNLGPSGNFTNEYPGVSRYRVRLMSVLDDFL